MRRSIGAIGEDYHTWPALACNECMIGTCLAVVVRFLLRYAHPDSTMFVFYTTRSKCEYRPGS